MRKDGGITRSETLIPFNSEVALMLLLLSVLRASVYFEHVRCVSTAAQEKKGILSIFCKCCCCQGPAAKLLTRMSFEMTIYGNTVHFT